MKTSFYTHIAIGEHGIAEASYSNAPKSEIGVKGILLSLILVTSLVLPLPLTAHSSRAPPISRHDYSKISGYGNKTMDLLLRWCSNNWTEPSKSATRYVWVLRLEWIEFLKEIEH